MKAMMQLTVVLAMGGASLSVVAANEPPKKQQGVGVAPVAAAPATKNDAGDANRQVTNYVLCALFGAFWGVVATVLLIVVLGTRGMGPDAPADPPDPAPGPRPSALAVRCAMQVADHMLRHHPRAVPERIRELRREADRLYAAGQYGPALWNVRAVQGYLDRF